MPDRLPRRPMRTVSPSCAALDGSPTTQYWNVSPRARQRLHHLQRAVVGGAFLVARDQHAERAADAADTFAAKRRQALIIAARLPFISAAPRPISSSPRTTAANGSTSHCSRGPARHDVGVAGEDERGRRCAAPRPEVVDLAEFQMLDGEAGLREQVRDQRLAARVGRGDGRAANQLASESQRIHMVAGLGPVM